MMGKIISISLPYGLRKKIEANIGMKQFVANANLVLRMEQRMISSRVFNDFHARRCFADPFFTWDDNDIQCHMQSDPSLAMFNTLSHRVLALGPLSIPASDEWIKSCYTDYYRQLFHIVGFSPESIIDLIYQTESSSEFMQKIESNILQPNLMPKKDILRKIAPYTPSKGRNLDESLFLLDNIVNMAACLYFYEDAVRFVVDTDCNDWFDILSWIPESLKTNYSIQDIFQYKDDIMIDFRLKDSRYSNFTVRLESIADHIAICNHNGKVLAETDSAKVLSVYTVQSCDIFTNFTQIVLIDECLTPGNERVFVMQHNTDMRCELGCACINRCTMIRSDERGCSPIEVCSLKRSKIEKDKCICNLVLPFDILPLCSYVLDCFYHRNSIGQKQELRDSLYADIPVSVHLKSYECDDFDTAHPLLPLHEYYELEKKNLQSGQSFIAEQTHKKVGEFKDFVSMYQFTPSTKKTR